MQVECNWVQLGDFKLDIQQHILYCNDTELSVEPKVLQLLLYLYQQQPRYVTLQELHDNVWSDRVVSDTAVRSAIKKLRTLFNDTDLNTPQYIKSVPKRGYKLVCHIEVHPSDNQEQAMPVKSEAESKAFHTIAVNRTGLRQWTPWYYIALAVVILMITLSIFSAKQLISKAIPSENIIGLTSVSPFPGEKFTLEVSSDDKLIAFTGKLASEQDNQVYLLDKQSGQVSQLTYDASNATFLSFAKNNSQIIYTDLIAGACSLKRVYLDGQKSELTPLLTSFHFIGDVHIGQAEDEVIVLLAKTLTDTPMYYRLNLDSLALSLLLSTSNTGENFLMAKLSPDKQKIAAIKELNNKQIELSVIDLTSKRQLLNKVLPHSTPRLDWKSDTELLLLYPNKLVLLDLTSQTEETLLVDAESRFSWLSASKNKLTLLQQDLSRKTQFYVEESLEPAQTCALDMCYQHDFLNIEGGVSSVFYADAQYKWITTKFGETNELALYDEAAHTKQAFFIGSDEIEILQYSVEQSALLVKLANRLAILRLNAAAGQDIEGQREQQQATLTYLTARHQVVSDAIFVVAEEGGYVFYGERIGGHWQIQKLDLTNMQTDVFIQDYRSIRSTRDGYVLANESGWLFTMANHQKTIMPLNKQINFTDITRWYVRGTMVLWSDFDYRFSYIHEFNLLSKQHQIRKARFYHLFPRIALSPVDNKLLYRSNTIEHNEIKELIFDTNLDK
ncbi:winged helix-turn-helix domain-containing protein [Shewanella surugensis]|uniref:Winged helix-turn-helix domain-containing protein n=1 Tax=Shewanella surugensis TaxID=212020 RepID=A0ABT0LAF1_9GAMM|nr:winged helix-turn-helix domain-containing protein [Shewanella surugensis]MCL1124661.1 winged helix-turn-helix domain-containing protein [Shewanella surugensis]